jgi:hypothetical protein
VVVHMFCSGLNNHPVCADSGCFAIFFFLAQPPLLARRGNKPQLNSFTPSTTVPVREGATPCFASRTTCKTMGIDTNPCEP